MLGIEHNPTAKVDRLAAKGGGYPPWTDGEREQYCAKHPPGTMARACHELLWHTGQRISGVAQFGHHNIKDGHLAFMQKKTGKYLEVWIPELAPIIAATTEGVFLRTPTGKPFTRATLRNYMRKWHDQARLKYCTVHGLRSRLGLLLRQHVNRRRKLTPHLVYNMRRLIQLERMAAAPA